MGCNLSNCRLSTAVAGAVSYCKKQSHKRVDKEHEKEEED